MGRTDKYNIYLYYNIYKYKYNIEIVNIESCLIAHWLRLHGSNIGGMGSITGWEVPHAMRSQKKKKKVNIIYNLSTMTSKHVKEPLNL